MPHKTRVIIVGGGPVGLITALQLGAAGLDVVVFEQGDVRHQEPRASTLHAATLDMLDDLGVYARIKPVSIVCPIVRYWDRRSGGLIAEFDHAVLQGETRHPWALQCEQDKLSRALGEMLKGYRNVTVLTQTRVTSCTQSDDVVEVTARGADGNETQWQAPYLVAADGAKSLIRAQADIAFEGFTYPERFLIVSTPYDFMSNGGFAYRNYVLDPEEWATLFKIAWHGPPGVWRMVTPVKPAETADVLAQRDTAQSRLQRFFPRDDDYDIPFFKWYTVDQRVAARFRKGRIILAGDAAHLNNPLGAMGLNSGLHDAVNLSSKLVSVLAGGDAGLLDLYERQRRHVAVEHVQTATMADKQNLEHRDPEVRAAYLAKLAQTAADPALAKRYMMRASLIESLQDAARIA